MNKATLYNVLPRLSRQHKLITYSQVTIESDPWSNIKPKGLEL